jgi:hypothetical protein
MDSGITIKQYEAEVAEVVNTIGQGKVQWNGLWKRLLKVWWKKLLFILTMFILPGGLIVLTVVGLVALLNWNSAHHEAVKRQDAIDKADGTYRWWR